MTLSTISPGEIRAKNRKAKNRRTWRTRAYRAEVARLTAGKCCSWCGRTDRLTIHHDEDWMYATEEAYISSLSKGWVLCTTCHLMARRGFVRCPTCDRGYTPRGRYDCKKCEDPAKAEAREVRKAQRRKRQRELRQQQYNRARDRIRHKGEGVRA